MTPFIEQRFPEDIALGSTGGPEYSTDIVVTNSGFEQRNSNWEQARARYNVAHGVKTQTQLDALIAFFRARKGRAVGFRFKDWTDFTAIGQLLGEGDGTTTQFQLRKTYSSGAGSDIRIITKPVSGSVTVYVNSIPQVSGLTIDYTTGIITFAAAPLEEDIIAADFEFDVPVRFDTDRLSAQLDDYNIRSWRDIPLVEVRI